MKTAARKLLGVPPKVSIRSYLHDLMWKWVFGQNRHVPWPVHFTSRVVAHEKVQRGSGSYPGDMPGCYIQAMNGIIIGDNCEFGPGVGIISANHDPGSLDHHLPERPVSIGNNCWVGMNAIILPGVVLGDRAIVGAGSVVTHSFPEGNCVVAGNPATVIRLL